MRTLLMTGTAIAALFVGMASVSAQTGGTEPRTPNARQDQGSPGRSESAPGQNRPAADDASRPGRSESAPGQNRPSADTSAPGRSESAPGQNRTGAADDQGTRTRTGQQGDDQGTRTRTGQQGGDDQGQRNRTGQSADDENQRDRNRQQADDPSKRDPNRQQADDQNQRERDRNRQADDPSRRDPNRQQADDQNQRDRDRNRQADDAESRDRDPNRQAKDRDGQDRDRNRQAGDDRNRDGGDAKLSVKLKGDEKAKVTATLVDRAKPVDRTKIKFNINVGTTVPRGEIDLQPLPETVISIVPQYRGYRYFVVEERIIIVEPSSYRIVEVVDRGGGGATGSSRLTIERSKFSLIKRELKPRGDIKVKFTAREGAMLPEDVELYDVPTTVVTEVPELRSYRYVVYEDNVVLVEPETRRIVEVIE